MRSRHPSTTRCATWCPPAPPPSRFTSAAATPTKRDGHGGAVPGRKTHAVLPDRRQRVPRTWHLRVVEDLLADTVLELYVAAPDGKEGSVIVDLGLVEF